MGVPSNLAKAKQLAVYWDNYINYLNTLDDRQPNIGNGKSKPPQTELFIQPFGGNFSATQYINPNATSSRWQTYKAAFGTHTKETINLAGSDTVLTGLKVRPAKIVIKTGLSTSRRVVLAKTTKRKYATYGGESGSVPFGKKNNTETELEAYEEILAALKTAIGANNQTVRVSRIREKF